MFWGLVLEPSKTYAQIVDIPFHVSMAALDLKHADNQEEASTLILRQDETEYVIANLSKKHKIFNIPLGLDFDVGEEIELHVQGQSQIHLTGFLAGETESECNDPDYQSTKYKDIKKAQAAKRKLKEASSSPSKKLKILDETLDDDTEEDDFTFDEDDLEGVDYSDESDEGSADDVSNEESSDEDEDEDMSASPPVKKEQKSHQKQADIQSSQSKKLKKKLKQPGNKQNNQQQGNKQSNQQQKNHHGQNKTPQTGHKTPQKNQLSNKTPQKTPQVKSPQPKTPQTGNKQQNAKSPQGTSNSTKHNRKILKGGIVVEDIVEGTGKVASSSKKVGVHYIGRLASNKKEFDNNFSRKPFNFNLGRGEVIRGWDLGLEGMREGGKRKIIIPAKFAYGQSGAPPTIPPNSALEFEVSLVNVK